MIEKPGIVIKRLREERRIKAVDFAEKIGMSKEQLSQTESGRSDTLSSDSVYKFANGFNMKPAELAGMLYGNAEATLDSLSEIVKLPVKGFINAGTPTLAEAVELGNAFIRKVDVSGAKKVSGLYCLRISGESLIGDQINNGDDVVIEPFTDLIDGKIYAVKLDNQFVARHVHREKGYVILTSSNGKYEKMKVKELEMVGRIIWSQPHGVKH